MLPLQCDGDALTLSHRKSRGVSGMLPFEACHLTSASTERVSFQFHIQIFRVSGFSHFSVICRVSVFSTRDSKLGGSKVCGPDLPGEAVPVFPGLSIHGGPNLNYFLLDCKCLHLMFISKPGGLAVYVTFLTY